MKLHSATFLVILLQQICLIVPQRQAYGITNFEVNQSIKRLEKVIRNLDSKLNRHELRERNFADFSTKTLNVLNSDHTKQKKNMKIVAKELRKLDENILAVNSLIQTTDERQRNLLNNISEGLNRLLMVRPDFQGGGDLPPLLPPSDMDNDVKSILTKVNSFDGFMKNTIKNLHQDTKLACSSLRQRVEQLSKEQQRINNEVSTCENNQVKALDEITSSLSQTGTLMADKISEIKSSGGGSCNSEIDTKLDALSKYHIEEQKELTLLSQNTQKALDQQNDYLEKLLKLSTEEKDTVENAFKEVFENLNNLQSQSENKISELEVSLNSVAEESSQQLNEKVSIIADTIKTNAETVMNALDDSASMSENLQYSLTENFEDLTKDIRSLKKVEQVMLSTADAVLDTKRSIEFGIQQIILELGQIVKDSGKNINSTLTKRINAISSIIVQNQTSALINMTSKMEKEIAQVWRQIGIMYQQVAQSVDMLGELKSTTSQQLNASLDKVGTMDGTVGAINNKVADVEDNLNYLLGRLSLVTSEFSDMKNGVGSELQKLRDMAREFSSKDLVEYKVNRKRSVNFADNSLFKTKLIF